MNLQKQTIGINSIKIPNNRIRQFIVAWTWCAVFFSCSFLWIRGDQMKQSHFDYSHLLLTPKSVYKEPEINLCPFGIQRPNEPDALKFCQSIANGTASKFILEEAINVTEHVDRFLLENDTFFPNCDDYFSHYCHFDQMRAVSKSEENFPLAFGFLIYHNFVQFEQLFRSMYRTHNFYCIHLDAKADANMQAKVKFRC